MSLAALDDLEHRVRSVRQAIADELAGAGHPIGAERGLACARMALASGPLRVGQLLRNISNGQPSYQQQKLCADGYSVLERDASDERCKVLRPTPRGLDAGRVVLAVLDRLLGKPRTRSRPAERAAAPAS